MVLSVMRFHFYPRAYGFRYAISHREMVFRMEIQYKFEIFISEIVLRFICVHIFDPTTEKKNEVQIMRILIILLIQRSVIFFFQ